MNSWYQKLNFWDKLLDKAIEAKSKFALQSLTSIQEMNAYCWKSRRPDKKEKTSKSHKKEKAKPADSQPTTLVRTQVSNKNP